MKKIIYFLEFILVYIFFIVFKIIGYKASSNLGFFIGKIFGPIFRSKTLIVKNLEKSKILIKKNNYEIAKLHGKICSQTSKKFSWLKCSEDTFKNISKFELDNDLK